MAFAYIELRLLSCQVEHGTDKLGGILFGNIVHHVIEGDARSGDCQAPFRANDGWLSVGFRFHLRNL